MGVLLEKSPEVTCKVTGGNACMKLTEFGPAQARRGGREWGWSEREEGLAWGGGLTRGGRGGGRGDRGSIEGDGGDGDGEGEGGNGEELAARGLGGVKREPFILRTGGGGR